MQNALHTILRQRALSTTHAYHASLPLCTISAILNILVLFVFPVFSLCFLLAYWRLTNFLLLCIVQGCVSLFHKREKNVLACDARACDHETRGWSGPSSCNTTSQGLRQSQRFVSNLIREIKDLVSIDFSVNAGFPEEQSAADYVIPKRMLQAAICSRH